MQQKTDFKQLTPQEWKLKVQAELAGLDYNEVLVWDTTDGIQVKPVYTSEDDIGGETLSIETTPDWKIIGNFLNNPKQDYSYLYGLTISDEYVESSLQLPTHLDLFFKSDNPFELLSKIDISKLNNLKYLNLDVLGHFAETGNWYQSQKEDLEFIQNLDKQPFEKCVEINASLYQNAGANHVQQIAIALSHGVEYIEKLGIEIAEKLYFKTAIGSNYFFEIAKLRALRKLWNLILAEYNSKAETYIFAETSLRNKSLLDIHNNIIRSGLEASAAVQGKADVVQILPYDELKETTAFSEELASKQQLLLQKESYFDKFSDPVSGSYFVENLTKLMVKNALDLFKKIESEGGFLQGLIEGTIQKRIQKSAEKEQQAFDEGEQVLIGVNKFRNPTDKTIPNTQPRNEVRTQVQPIFRKRLAEKIESTE
ncbi:MAG: methylmalonyl-CoA mutase family protein [Moheibacter sp.]